MVQLISTHEAALSYLFLPPLHGSVGLPCSALSFFRAPRDMSTDMGLGYPHARILQAQENHPFVFPALTFSDALRHPAAETQNLQVTLHCPSVWQGVGQWWH